MSTPNPNNVRAEVNAFCHEVGADPLLVQGAGGNVSWKDGDTLWVKASGTCLGEALSKDLFAAVALPPLRQAIAHGGLHQFQMPIASRGPARPSIETWLHALLPQTHVVHLHAVEVLAHMVKAQPLAVLNARMDKRWPWCFVPYTKPGAELAAAVAQALEQEPAAQIVFLANHGLVIGANSLDEIRALLQHVLQRLQSPLQLSFDAVTSEIPLPTDDAGGEQVLEALKNGGYAPCPEQKIQALARQPQLLEHLKNWAICPDHVVFLGAEAPLCAFKDVPAFIQSHPKPSPPFLIVPRVGVFANQQASAMHIAQLRCYAEVMSRLSADEPLQMLSFQQIEELIHWEAEKYRKAQQAR